MFQGFLPINENAINICVQIFVCTWFSFPWDRLAGVKLLGPVRVLCLGFRVTVKVVFGVTIPFKNAHQQWMSDPVYLCTCQNLEFSCFITAVKTGCTEILLWFWFSFHLGLVMLSVFAYTHVPSVYAPWCNVCSRCLHVF